MEWLARFVNPTYLTFFGGALVLIGALLSSHNQSREAKRAESFLAELKSKNKEIVNLQEDLKQTVTGGDSFVYLEFQKNSENQSFVLRHQGKYPVYDVSFYIQNMRIKLAEPNNVMAYQNPDFAVVTSDTQVEIPNLYPKDDELINEYSIKIQTRSGVFHEFLQVAKIKNGFASAYVVYRKNKNTLTLIKEQAEAGFPRASDGSVKGPKVSIDASGKISIGLQNYDFKEKDNN